MKKLQRKLPVMQAKIDHQSEVIEQRNEMLSNALAKIKELEAEIVTMTVDRDEWRIYATADE